MHYPQDFQKLVVVFIKGILAMATLLESEDLRAIGEQSYYVRLDRKASQSLKRRCPHAYNY